MSNQNLWLLRTTGMLGVVASALMLASDCIIMDSSTSGSDVIHGWLDRFSASPNWRLKTSGLLAPIGSILFVGGFAHIYLALKPGGKILAFVTASLMTFGYNILAAWHCATPMFAFIKRNQPNMTNPAENEGWQYLEFLGFYGFVPIFVGLVFLPALIVFCRTRYPKWFCVLTPLVIYAISMVTFRYLPAPFGGYMVIGSGSISLLMFFTMSTILLWNGGKQVETETITA